MWKSARTAFKDSKPIPSLSPVSQNSVQSFSPKRRKHKATSWSWESTQPVIDATTITVGQVIDKAVVQEIPLERPPLRRPSRYSFPARSLRHKMDFSPRLCVDRVPSRSIPPVAAKTPVNFMINGIKLERHGAENQVTFQAHDQHRLRIQDRQLPRTAPNTAATPARS